MSVFRKVEPNDIRVTPFNVHKRFFGSRDFAADDYDRIFLYKGFFEFGQFSLGDSTNRHVRALTQTANDKYEYLIHHSVNHLFYAKYNPPPAKLPDFTQTNLYKLGEFCACFSIPQDIWGEGIKRETVEINLNVSGSQRLLIDNEHGYIIDTFISQSYYPYFTELEQNKVADWNFVDGYIYRPEFKILEAEIHDNTIHDKTLILNNVIFEDVEGGKKATFVNDENLSYGRVDHNDLWNFNTNEDFAVIVVGEISPGTINSAFSKSVLVTKNGRQSKNSHGKKHYGLNRVSNTRYPFAIEVDNRNVTGSLMASRYDGKTISKIQTSTTFHDNETHHILFQKSGSELQLFVDGNIEASGSDFSEFETTNFCDLFVGMKGDEVYFLSGSIAQLSIYNRAFSAETIQQIAMPQLSQSLNPFVGNVFYNDGIAVLTNQSKYYRDLYSLPVEEVNWSIEGRGTKTIYEYEVTCTVESGELNKTLNPSAREGSRIDSQVYAGFATHSMFSPYVTQVGLYSDLGELLVVATISVPIKKMENSDMTFVVRFDV